MNSQTHTGSDGVRQQVHDPDAVRIGERLEDRGKRVGLLTRDVGRRHGRQQSTGAIGSSFIERAVTGPPSTNVDEGH